MTTITVTGLKELNEKLKQIPEEVSKKYMLAALKKGAEPILAEAISAAPSKTGKLVSQMNIKGSTTSGKSSAKVGIGDAYYGRMQDQGWQPGKRGAGRYLRKLAGKEHSFVQGKFFMEQALDKAAEEAVNIIADDLKISIEIFWATPMPL